MDIFLASSEEAARVFKQGPLYSGVDFFLVSDGPAQFQGRRIKNAYIDRFCHEDPNYMACLDVIYSSICLTSNEGKMFLV